MSRYLLDTHSLIWWWTDASRLGQAGRNIIEEGASEICVSVASVWEIAIKSSSGKLPEIEDFRRDDAPLMTANGFMALDILDRHALRAGFLEGKHRDPFDRLIAAQAIIDDLTVITKDREIAAFGCKVLW
ncbi:type II toxin-antitoxin system VapC family toxin [Sphingomonas sp. M1-B02]|uniref:type II toxin-antitoxin system VapC family toxin n=1 Tax=Sphingomonas sp. M1-B02 TaxID=3114300 RepID=UPI00223ED334|nr:type II toxin-antitoxin system VapC family toxin [Sphingomonas sp. S6-11]UZK64731.1 type II toxin-antitoxin system VapC family toxin [Sphingomonas sp. S6-11]